jgi:integrase
MDGMPRPRLPYLHLQITRHGERVFYVRTDKKAPRVRIRGEYGSEQFMAEYKAAIAGNPVRQKAGKAHRASLRWLCDEWRKSSAWYRTAQATKRQRENILHRLLTDNGKIPFLDIKATHIMAGRERRMKTPFAANNFLKTMRALFAWAIEAGHCTVNPAAGVKFLSRKTGGHEPWTQDEIAAFRERWPLGTRARVALETIYLTGLRRGDACRLGRQHIGKDGIGRIRMEKTGAVVSFAVPPHLAEVWAQGPCGDLTFIAGEKGRPMAKEALGNQFREWCQAAGIEKSAHGLRKLAAAEVADAGGSEIELQKAFGWATLGQSSVYTRNANAEALAKSAAGKRFKNISIPSPAKR